nr:rabaptin, RAB GTPase binding effector protein 2 [Molossus molossus]
MEGRQLQKDLENISRERDELQEGLRRSNEDCAKQMQVLLAQVQNSEQLLQTLQGTVSQAQERVQLQMAELATSHKCLSHEVKRLTEENQGLRAEQPPSSAPRALEQDEGQEESLPSSVPELQQLVRHMGQEARAHQQAREHEAERLRIEIVKLREALEEETVARASLEGQLRVQQEETGERPPCAASGQRWSGSIRNRARLSSQTSSQNRGQRCCGCRLSWRPVNRCRGILYDCPRPCRCAWNRSARQRVWSKCAASWMRHRLGTSRTSRTPEGPGPPALGRLPFSTAEP